MSQVQVSARAAASRAEEQPIVGRYHLNNTTTPVDSLVTRVQKGEISLHAPYQRGSVWSEDRQRNLIRSLLMGLPVGSVFINRPSLSEKNVVIDGKQRLIALTRWQEGELSVPRAWFSDEYVEEGALSEEMITFNQLSDEGNMFWMNSADISTYWVQIRGATDEERTATERELFDLINYGGVPQGESDEAAAEDLSQPEFRS